MKRRALEEKYELRREFERLICALERKKEQIKKEISNFQLENTSYNRGAISMLMRHIAALVDRVQLAKTTYQKYFCMTTDNNREKPRESPAEAEICNEPFPIDDAYDEDVDEMDRAEELSDFQDVSSDDQSCDDDEMFQ